MEEIILNYFKFNEKLEKYSDLATQKAEKRFKYIDDITEYNQTKVLNAFIKNKDILKNEYKKVLYNYRHIPAPIKELLTNLKEGKSITPEIFDHLVEEDLQ